MKTQIFRPAFAPNGNKKHGYRLQEGFAKRLPLMVFLVLTAQSEAQVSSVFELVAECDVLAAHPDDPQRMADGVADEQIVPQLAILACEAAFDLEPEEPRFAFQLGRALLAVGREDEAFALFEEAAEADYSAAWAYLGDAYQFGLGASIDGQRAFEAYERALELGFLEAESQIEQLTFESSLFTLPFFGFFFEGNYERINSIVQADATNATMRNYVYTMIQTLIFECEPFLEPGNVPALYAFRYPESWTPEADNSINVAIQTSIAEYDAATFLRRHGCDGLIARHFFESFNRYLEVNP